MRNPLVHLLFLVAPFLIGELGREIASAMPAPRVPTEVCTTTAAPKSAPAPSAPPRTNAAKPATPTARRPLPAHLFM